MTNWRQEKQLKPQRMTLLILVFSFLIIALISPAVLSIIHIEIHHAHRDVGHRFPGHEPHEACGLCVFLFEWIADFSHTALILVFSAAWLALILLVPLSPNKSCRWFPNSLTQVSQKIQLNN